MKQRIIRSGLVGALAVVTMPVAAQSYGQPAYGPEAASYNAQARVVSSVPIREAATSAPRQECWTEHSEPSGGGNRAVGTVIGGIAGGLIGHQIGSGSGNTAATIAGTLGGAAVGNEVARRQGGGDTRAVERCRTVADHQDRIVGYDVVYRFQGREFQTRLPYEPGAELPVQVTVAPAR
ncbi:MAG TPA: glycine zipper 2TM domain-containing protein [Casimicrobiaceae bacterium]|nr:glycine zipper 2TM domain-containing protein [Casimicrobiaceae bacterium]